MTDDPQVCQRDPTEESQAARQPTLAPEHGVRRVGSRITESGSMIYVLPVPPFVRPCLGRIAVAPQRDVLVERSYVPAPSQGARAFIPALLACIVLIGLAPAPPAAAATLTTEAQQIIQIARTKIGDPWRYGATGPSAFDCSGLVIYAFRAAGDGAAIGNGNYRSARSMYDWFRSRGLASRSNPRAGDLVIWGSGSHIGIYIGGGLAISTLRSGVTVRGVTALTVTFTAYLRTGMSTKLISGATAAGATTASATTTTAVIATRVTTTRVNLRTGHSISASRITVLPAGRSLRVFHTWRDASGRTWLNVSTGGLTGWVAGWLTRPA